MKHSIHIYIFFLLLFSAHMFAVPEKLYSTKDAPLDVDPKKKIPNFSVLTCNYAQRNPAWIRKGGVFFPVYKLSYIPDCFLAQMPETKRQHISFPSFPYRTTFALRNWHIQNQINSALASEFSTCSLERTEAVRLQEMKKKIKEGASVNAITWCAFYGKITLSDTLLNHAIHYAKFLSEIQLLLKLKADVNAHPFNTQTPLTAAVYKHDCTTRNKEEEQQQLDIVKLLIHSNANINAVSGENKGAALHQAAIKFNPKMIKLLLKEGAQSSLKTQNGNGQTILEAALWNTADPKDDYDYNSSLRYSPPENIFQTLVLLRAQAATARHLPEVLQFLSTSHYYSKTEYRKIRKFFLFYGAPPQTNADVKVKQKIDLAKNIYGKLPEELIPDLRTLVAEYAAPLLTESENDQALKDATLLERMVLADDFLSKEEAAELYKEQPEAPQASTIHAQIPPTPKSWCTVS